MYHAIARNAEGNYAVESEDPGRAAFLSPDGNIPRHAGAPVYAYSAIFSPTSLNTENCPRMAVLRAEARVDHDEPRRAACSRRPRARVPHILRKDSGIAAGAWRVNVETPGGALLGRLRFNVVLQAADPALITQIKN